MDPSERLVSQLEFHPTRPEEERIGKSCTFAIARAAQDGAKKKEQGYAKPCSKNCVDPIYPLFGFDSDWRGDAASARQGSSRDLDHQTRPCGKSEPKLLDHLIRLVIIFGNECSNFAHLEK